MARVLVVDDDFDLRDMLAHKLELKGYEAGVAGTLEQGLASVEEDDWDVVLLDVQMPDGNGLQYIPRFISSRSEPEVIIITGDGQADGAEIAISSGAWSYIDKSRSCSELDLLLPRTLQYREEKKRFNAAPVALRRRNIIGNSESLAHCLDDLAKAAASDINVLITGETGTGKEVFARAVHENSSRWGNDFVVVDCAAIPENLIESNLFGYVKGAFTGADRPHGGLLGEADGGTLFLDEVGELPAGMQKRFLRVLQERCYRPLGSTKEERSNFRLVAATNRDLEKMVEDGLFRRDLYHRLKGVTIHLPPLRQRKEDIRELVTHFLQKICSSYGLEIKGFSPDFIEALTSYDWPGNVRELVQILEHILTANIEVPTLYSVHLPKPFRVRLARSAIGEEKNGSSSDSAEKPSREQILPWRDFKAAIEKEYAEKLMARCGGRVQEACRLSGLSRTRLYQILNKHDISGH